MKLNPIIIVLFCFFGCILIINLLFFENLTQANDLVPTTVPHDQFYKTYHSIDDMYNIMMSTPLLQLNPKYIVYDLTTAITDIQQKILLYAPKAMHNPTKKTLRVMITCGQHGRELVTPEVCLSMIRLIRGDVYDQEISNHFKLLEELGTDFFIVPVSNPWAKKYVETSKDSCRRNNQNNVDLNRNYPPIDEQLGVRNRSPPTVESAETYPGPYPLSEYETQAVKSALETVHPHILFNIHSGSNDIILPYDVTSFVLPKHYSLMVAAGNAARNVYCPECRLGSSHILLYQSNGTLIDYALLNSPKLISGYTMEIYQDPYRDFHEDCFLFFNPLEGEQLKKTLKKWINIVNTIIEAHHNLTIKK